MHLQKFDECAVLLAEVGFLPLWACCSILAEVGFLPLWACYSVLAEHAEQRAVLC